MVNPLSPWLVGITGIRAKDSHANAEAEATMSARSCVSPASRRRVRAPTDPCGAPLPAPPVFYRRGRPDIEIDAPFLHLHLNRWRPSSCGGCTRTRKNILANTWRGSSSSRKIFTGLPTSSISSRSLRDVRNVLRSLYRGLIQLKRLPDDGPDIVEVWL